MPEVTINEIRTDGGTQPRTNLYEETVAEYTEALQGGAQFPPVVVFHDGSDYWLADGFHRFHAYRAFPSYKIPAEVHQGTRQDARDYANSGAPNGRHGMREKPEDRWRRIENMLNDHPDWSNVEVARHCEVAEGTVRNVKGRIFANYEDTGERTVNRNGTTYTQNTSNIGRGPKDDPQHFATTHEDHKKPPESTGSFHVSTGEVEWYTPSDFIDRVRLVMGSIDTDPASSAMAQETVQAENYYTKEDDGLSGEWHGCVFVNPPYSMPEVAQFADRAVKAVSEGECDQMIVLVNNATDTDWFHRLLSACDRVCLTDGRVRFYNNSGETLQTRQGQAVFYFGANVDAFKDVFSNQGAVLVRDEKK